MARRPSAKMNSVAMEGVENVVAFDVFVDALKKLRDRRADELSDTVIGKIWDDVRATGEAPAKSMWVKEGNARVKTSFTRKTSAQPLAPAAIKTLTEAGVAFDAPSQQVLEINGKLGKDQAVLTNLCKLLDKHGDKFGIPADFLEYSLPKVTVTDDIVHDVFLLEDFQKVMALVPLIGSIKVTEAEMNGELPMTRAADIITNFLPEIAAMDKEAA